MKKHISLSLGLALMLPALTACDDYLDKEPSKNSSKTITEISQLDAMLASYTTFISEYNYNFINSDDYGLTPEIEKVRTSHTSGDDADELTWSTDNKRTSRTMWNDEYYKIFCCNLVLNNLGNVKGSEEEKAEVKAEAHFLRAYSMLQLVVNNCLYPAQENSGELGLTLKASVSFEESLTRATLGETVKFIEDDITEALKITRRVMKNGKMHNWRCTTTAAKALAARFYLYTGDLQKAGQYADAALAEHQLLKDLNDPEEMSFAPDPIPYTINEGTPEEEKVYVKHCYLYDNRLSGSSGYPILFEWKDLIYTRTLSYASWWFLPSKSLLDTYARDIKDSNPDNDLRYRYYMVEDYGLRYCKKTTAGRTYGYTQFYLDQIISGLTVGEMLLIKAETLARSGDASGAVALLDILRKARIDAAAYENLPVGSAADALRMVIDERRREMPFTARWYDLKRYNWNSDPSDDVTITRMFYPHNASTILVNDQLETYTLEPKSRRYARPIPEIDIVRSDNQLVQNTY